MLSKMWFCRFAVGMVVGLSCFTALAAQVVADRPGFATGTETVAAQRFNLEVGYQIDRYNANTVQSIPTSNIRAGITNSFELNLQWSYRDVEKGEEEADAALGFKQRVIDESRYNLSLLGSIGARTGKKSTMNMDQATVVAGLLWDVELDATLDLFGAVQAESSEIEKKREVSLQFALGVNYSASDRFGSFIELYRDAPMSHTADSQTLLNGGFTYLVDSSLQLDLYVGKAVSGEKVDFIGFGIAKLF